MSEESFEEALLEEADEVLQALGNNIRKAIYYHVKTVFGLDKCDIPRKPAVFSSALKLLFGHSAEIIEERILKNLCLEFKIPVSNVQGSSFASSLDEIRKRYEARRGQT